MNRWSATAALVCVLVLGLGSCSFFGGFATEHYVHPGGDDNAFGDAAGPWRSIATALSRATPGDTIHVAPGLYYERIVVTQSGSEGSPIRIVGASGAVLDGSQDTHDYGEALWGGLLELQGASHIEISGLTIRNTKGCGIFARDDCSFITITGVSTTSTTGSGIALWDAREVVVRGSSVQDTSTSNSGAGIQLVSAVGFEVSANTVTGVGTATYTEDGISVARASSNGSVFDNDVSDCEGAGIVLEAWSPSTVSDIEIYGNRIDDVDTGINLRASESQVLEDVVVRGNTIEGAGRGVALTSASSAEFGSIEVSANRIVGGEIGMAVQPGAGATVSGLSIHNNVVSGTTTYGFSAIGMASASAPRLSGVKLVNNTFYNPNADGGLGYAARIESSWTADSGLTIANNIFAENVYASVAVESEVPSGMVVVDTNLFTEGPLGTDNETHGTNAMVGSTPLFVDASAGDFHLAAGAPAVDAGRSTDAPAIDCDGKARPQGAAVDLGAFEFGP